MIKMKELTKKDKAYCAILKIVLEYEDSEFFSKYYDELNDLLEYFKGEYPDFITVED